MMSMVNLHLGIFQPGELKHLKSIYILRRPYPLVHDEIDLECVLHSSFVCDGGDTLGEGDGDDDGDDGLVIGCHHSIFLHQLS